MLRNSGHGSLLIMVRDTRLALGRSEAAWIEVEPIAAGDKLTWSHDRQSGDKQMPQLVKRGKWVFGRVVVGKRRNITIPPDCLS